MEISAWCGFLDTHYRYFDYTDGDSIAQNVPQTYDGHGDGL